MQTKTTTQVKIVAPSIQDPNDPAVRGVDWTTTAQRLAENVVAAMDDQMQELPDNPGNSGIKNLLWAEGRGRQSDLFAYDADRYAMSSVSLPVDSPDRVPGEILTSGAQSGNAE